MKSSYARGTKHGAEITVETVARRSTRGFGRQQKSKERRTERAALFLCACTRSRKRSSVEPAEAYPAAE
jgi:hypothetical protein